jgi:hypothetical protein
LTAFDSVLATLADNESRNVDNIVKVFGWEHAMLALSGQQRGTNKERTVRGQVNYGSITPLASSRTAIQIGR